MTLSCYNPVSEDVGRLRVLVLHWGSNGGGPKFSADLAGAISSVPGVEMHLSYSTYADNVRDWENLGFGAHTVKTYKNLFQFVTGIFRWFSSVGRFRRYLMERRIDVVVSGMMSMWQSLSLPYLIPRRVYYVASIHDPKDHPGEASLLKSVARMKEMRRADMIAVYSEYAAREVRKKARSGQPIGTYSLGADVVDDIARTLPTARAVTIGFFGRIVKYKGLGLFVESIGELRRRGANVRGVVYGSGSVPAEMIEASAEWIDWNVRWIESDEIGPIFRSIDLLLLSYTEASQSGVMTTALGYGVPVVATPVGGLVEQIEKSGGGLLAESVDAEAVADAVERLLESSDLYEQLSGAGIGAARTSLSWHSVGSALIGDVRKNLAGIEWRRVNS